VSRASERIVDVIFERERAPRSSRGTVALGVGIGAHALLIVGAIQGGPSLEAWAAEVSVRVHAELTRTEVVELPKDPPQGAEPPPPAPPLVRKAPSFQLEGGHPMPPHDHRQTALHPTEPAPSHAEAGQVLAARSRWRGARHAGRVESASIESDPGLGFGRAALECARAMQYAPALDRDGRPTRASASIRVRFWR